MFIEQPLAFPKSGKNTLSSPSSFILQPKLGILRHWTVCCLYTLKIVSENTRIVTISTLKNIFQDKKITKKNVIIGKLQHKGSSIVSKIMFPVQIRKAVVYF